MSFSPRDPVIHAQLIQRCLEAARTAFSTEDVPVGALVVAPDGQIVGSGVNTRERDQDPRGHAELNALTEAAARTGSWRMDGCTLVSTLEPCPMCAGAISQTRISTLIFGAWDEKAGACGSVFDVLRDPRMNHFVEVHPGVLAEECAQVLGTFFEARRSTGGTPHQAR